MKFICSVCGSDDVQSKAWCYANTDQIADYVSEEANDNYCCQCEDHVVLISVQETL